MELLTQSRGRALALVVALLCAPWSAGAAERPLTLSDAVRLALQKNEGLVIERESLVSATANARGARGAYDPTLALNGGWSRATEPANSAFSGAPAGRFAPEVKSTDAGAALRQLLPSGGALSLRAQGSKQTTDGVFELLSPAYATSVGVELRQPLLRNLAIDPARLSVRVADAGRHEASASLRRAVSETVAAVEQAYWNLVAADEGVRVREDAVRLAEQQLDETRSRVQTGSTPGTELSQPRAELERRRGDLLAERETLARAQNTLKLLILADGDEAAWLETIEPTDSAGVAAAPVDVPGALAHALASRPEVDAARAALQRRHAETAYARSGVWPSLDVVVSYDRFGLAGTRNPAGPSAAIPADFEGDLGQSFQTLSDGDFDETRVALELSLPIRNRSAQATAAIAHSVERQSEADLARVRKNIRAEVLDAAAALETAGQRIEATRAGREAAEVQLAAERDRFTTGLSTNFLVLTRQNDLSRARLDEISARTDYESARTEMARATGSLIEERGIDVPGTTR
jgi:outer membrane protein TolC